MYEILECSTLRSSNHNLHLTTTNTVRPRFQVIFIHCRWGPNSTLNRPLKLSTEIDNHSSNLDLELKVKSMPLLSSVNEKPVQFKSFCNSKRSEKKILNHSWRLLNTLIPWIIWICVHGGLCVSRNFELDLANVKIRDATVIPCSTSTPKSWFQFEARVRKRLRGLLQLPGSDDDCWKLK